LRNCGQKSLIVKKGVRIAQLLIQPQIDVPDEEDSGNGSGEEKRGEKGFGSTGV